VRTFVTADADHLVTDVILREVERGGQVFFVHNRVKSIDRAADRIRRLLPNVRVGVAHGQMEEGQLAKMMVDFIRREFDVLVCTTIIESGLDIPTANTILVQDADRFGLADLYQLRGRVGRSNQRAYAYFLYDPKRSLTEHADKRLDVIGEYQELGSGFKLALKDLEIRGAGNLLGKEQSGEIAAVGLEMYNQMLRGAVATMKGEAPEAAMPVGAAVAPLDLPLDHYLPHDYVPDEKVRLQVYQELAAATKEAQLQTLARRLKDRFGPLPGAVENLLYSLNVKLLAQAAGLVSITSSVGTLEMRMPPSHELELVAVANSHRYVTARKSRLELDFKAAGESWQEVLLEVLAELADLRPAA
jgi:transcription-repair coupling factor (superfamily II helicase)